MSAATLLGLLVCEIGLRGAGISYPIVYQIDGNLGASLRSGAEGLWKSESETYIRINSTGLRDREHDRVKPAQSLRIAVLRDSFAEAVQVPLVLWQDTDADVHGQCAVGEGENTSGVNPVRTRCLSDEVLHLELELKKRKRGLENQQNQYVQFSLGNCSEGKAALPVLGVLLNLSPVIRISLERLSSDRNIC
jgi:hypothetical protein